MDVVSGVAVMRVCTPGAGVGAGAFVALTLISVRTGGPHAALRSGSGISGLRPSAMGTTAVMCVSGP
eukprot:13924604-Heterocapsa_arctica.AAC.1